MASQSFGVIVADNTEEASSSASGFDEPYVGIVTPEPSDEGTDENSGKDRPRMQRRFFSDDDLPAELRQTVDVACRRLMLTRKRDRVAIGRQLRLEREFYGCYVAYIPTRKGIDVIASARPGVDDIYQQIEIAGGLKESERSKVVIEIPVTGDNEQAAIWSPFAERQV